MKILLAASLPLVLAGCGQPFVPPPETALTRPADPATARLAPAGPTVTFNARRIEEPGDWRSLNDAQVPGGSS